MYKNFYITIAFLVVSNFATAQQVISWEDLSDVQFEEKFYEDIGEYLLYPTFGPGVLDFDRKYLEITGFIIPIEADQTVYVLSQNPYASCFFCGQAGPETIIELELINPPKKAYELDAIMTFKGTLHLNDKDVDHCNYILKEAQLTK